MTHTLCDNCESNKLVQVSAKASDLHWWKFLDTGKENSGYLPDNLGIGGGDYVEMTYCLNCGKIQGKFPKRGKK